MENRTFTTSAEGITLLKKLVDNQINLGVNSLDGVVLIQLYNHLDAAQILRSGTASVPEVHSHTGDRQDYALFFRGEEKVPVIKLIRQVTGLGLKEAKDLSDQALFCPTANANKLILKNLPSSIAVHIRDNLVHEAEGYSGFRGRHVFINLRSDTSDDSPVVSI